MIWCRCLDRLVSFKTLQTKVDCASSVLNIQQLSDWWGYMSILINTLQGNQIKCTNAILIQWRRRTFQIRYIFSMYYMIGLCTSLCYEWSNGSLDCCEYPGYFPSNKDICTFQNAKKFVFICMMQLQCLHLVLLKSMWFVRRLKQ